MELSKQIKNIEQRQIYRKRSWQIKFMFQDKLYQIGKMKKIILILKV